MDGEFRVRQWHAATALLNQRVTRLVFIVDDLHADFIATALQRELTALQGTKAYTTVDHLSGKQIAEAVIALPPATEQARIVARVDELMQLCDALEAKGRLEAQQHARLLETLLGTLTDSTTPEELAANWQRVAEHFDFLLDRPEAVDVLEQTVLQLATSGRFSSREPHLQTSSVELADQGSAALPFAVPADWSWISLGQLTSLVTSGSRSWKDYYSDEGATFIRSQDIKYDRLEFDNRAYVRIPPSAEGVRTQVRPRDVLITITGANVGKAAVVEGPLSEAYVSQHVALVRLLDPRIADYLHLWLVNEHGGRLRLLGSSYGAKPGLNLQNIKDLPVPMPPLEEQVRIAARVADLRRLCTDLRQRLAASQATQSRLAEALMATEA
jgi:type I restriction enzyme S subunit